MNWKRGEPKCYIYIAYGCDIVRDKISCDNYTNQITTGIVVNSTKETEPIYLNGEYYPYYPKIREEDINTNTSNIFVDTMQISNIYLAGMGADFDGVKMSDIGILTISAYMVTCMFSGVNCL